MELLCGQRSQSWKVALRVPGIQCETVNLFFQPLPFWKRMSFTYTTVYFQLSSSFACHFFCNTFLADFPLSIPVFPDSVSQTTLLSKSPLEISSSNITSIITCKPGATKTHLPIQIPLLGFQIPAKFLSNSNTICLSQLSFAFLKIVSLFLEL